MALSDLEWPLHGSASRAISAVAELLVTCCYSTRFTLRFGCSAFCFWCTEHAKHAPRQRPAVVGQSRGDRPAMTFITLRCGLTHVHRSSPTCIAQCATGSLRCSSELTCQATITSTIRYDYEPVTTTVVRVD